MNRKKYCEVEFTYGRVDKLEWSVERVEILMIERNVFKDEITTKQIYRQFIALNSLNKLPEAVYDDFLYHSFDHWNSF
jgi:hypothetical protein